MVAARSIVASDWSRARERVRRPAQELVDLDDPTAVKRAIALHRAGRAVFAIPFNSPGAGTLTWLDPGRLSEP